MLTDGVHVPLWLATVRDALAYALQARLTALHIPREQLLLPGEGHWFSAPAQLRILGAFAAFLGRELR